MKTLRLNHSRLKLCFSLVLLCAILSVYFFVTNTEKTVETLKDIPLNLSASSYEVSLDEFRNGAEVGNPLIDNYGKNNPRLAGENGNGVVLTKTQKTQADSIMDKHHLNTLISDIIPLNRMVPDSRIPG